MNIVAFTKADYVCIVCGYTDLRRGIDGLASIISNDYEMDIFANSVFLFCGHRSDRYKALHWDGDGFMLLYKRLENGKLQWPKSDNEVRQLTEQQVRWLLEGLKEEQQKSIKPVNPDHVSWSSQFG
ncbi:IS66 family insertion sequence element accessory protein TnpB [Weissella confusa]|uniref:IS66 family insertion sequence element accessory protein TnpB n=1 Tax=Weissella confusa TaxID=1583 RepID=UPI0022E52EDA|nr:IS66 family insertion sequence element accessory protein TnpB [Weissella confusa]